MPNYYNEKQYQDILKPDSRESPILMPNEIFHELPKELNPIEKGTSSKHIAFAFTYVFLITYLYRYTKYGLNQGENNFTEKELKKMLTVSPTSKGKDGINYIVKKGGVLESLGYIEKGEEAPVSWEMVEETDSIGNVNYEVYFVFNSFYNIEILSKGQYLSTQNCNLPLKLLIELTEIEYELDEEGNEIKENIVEEHVLGEYFVRAKHTTSIDVNIFIYCMIRKDLGVQAFYLYSFIKYKTGYFGGNWERPLTGIAEDTGMKLHTIKRTLKSMEEHNMIWSSHEVFVKGLDKIGEQKNASQYDIYQYKKFIHNGTTKEVKVREIIGVKEWQARKKNRAIVDKLSKLNNSVG